MQAIESNRKPPGPASLKLDGFLLVRSFPDLAFLAGSISILCQMHASRGGGVQPRPVRFEAAFQPGFGAVLGPAVAFCARSS